MTGDRLAPPSATGPSPDGPDPRRRVPAWLAALLLGLAGAGLVLVALLAGRAGPLVAHPPTITPGPPPTMTMPAVTMPSLPSRPPAQHSDISSAWLWGIAAVIVGLALLLVIIWLVRLLRRPGRIAAPPVASATPSLSPVEFGFLDAEAEVDLTDDRTFDPQRAADDIIASWTAVQTVAARRGVGRPPSSTPTEFLQSATDRFGDPDLPEADLRRAVGDEALGPAPIGGRWLASTVLLRLYHRARFDTAALAPGAATAARAAARTLITHWRTTVPDEVAADESAPGDDAAGPTPPAGSSGAGR